MPTNHIPPEHDELESLLVDWEDGSIDDAGVERIRKILRSDASARQLFVQHQLLSALLHLQGAAPLQPHETSETAVSNPSPVRRHLTAGRFTMLMATAVAAAFCVLTARLLFLEYSINSGSSVPGTPLDVPPADQVAVAPHDQMRRDQPGRDQPAEATSQGVALVTRLVDVQWGDGQAAMDVGDALTPGPFRLQQGFAQIEFFCGATVVVEGPAELDLKTPLLAKVRRGRLRAQVPPAARGFSLEAEQLTVVDLGTEFGLSVSSGQANVEVFDGEVELQPKDSEPRLLTAGQAVIHDGARYQSSEVTQNQFVDIAGLRSRAEGQQDQRFQRWMNWSNEFRKDPRLIAYYAFEQHDTRQRRLISSLRPLNSELDGAIVGAGRVAGRWPGKEGLEFKRPGDRVRMQIPGEYRSLTFACWAKIDSLDRWYNSLFLTDNYNEGEPHWQILDSGQLFFSVRVKKDDGSGPEHREVLSPSFWDHSLSGKWLHLATSYDVDQQQVTHYVNGDVIHREQVPDHQLVTTTRFGRSTLGNWSSPQRPDARFAIRNLNGSIDEFAIFAASLTGEEIKEMYENGKP
ncbi:MAG: LamG-like jellyroll fold domain-containing protein [Planctomycetota bacterium]